MVWNLDKEKDCVIKQEIQKIKKDFKNQNIQEQKGLENMKDDNENGYFGLHFDTYDKHIWHNDSELLLFLKFQAFITVIATIAR